MKDQSRSISIVRFGLLTGAAIVALALPTALGAQEPDSMTYVDDLARELIEGVLHTRGPEGISSSRTAALQSRSHIGLLIPNQWNWRHRTLFRKEVAGAVRYENRLLVESQVLGRSRGSPLIGDDLIDEPALWGYFGFDPEAERPALLGLVGLALEGVGTEIPQSDSMPNHFNLFDSTFVDPLGAEGPSYYRYASGPDLVRADEMPSRLLSVEFHPKHEEDSNFAGIVWFDPDTKQPFRAMLRPHGRWNLHAGLRGFIRKIPVVPKNAQGEIEFMSIDFTPQADGLSVATDARTVGTMYLFWDQAILPVEMEWVLDWAAEDPLGDSLPPPPLEGGWSFNRSHDLGRKELNAFLRELDRVGGTPPAPGWRKTATRAVSSVRFNQVQGVNFAVVYPLPVGPTSVLEARLEVPTSSFQPTGMLSFKKERRPGTLGVSGYSRLRDANWMEHVNGVTNTISALLSGYDDGNYYLADGGAFTGELQKRPLDLTVELFGEYQSDAPKTATYSLFNRTPPEDAPPEIEVDEGSYFGFRARMDVQVGDDPQKGVAVVRLYGSAVGGASAYTSIGTTSDVVWPLPGPFTGAIRGTLNIASGNVPSQALFYLGGSKTVRGYPPNSASGPSAFIGTAEIATALPLIRLVAFADLGYAGEFGKVFRQKGLGALGGGISIGDGAVRIDFARGVGEGGVWRMHFLTSGLF